MAGNLQTILGANGTIGSLLAADLRAYTDRIRLVSRNPRKVRDSDELFPADLSLPGNTPDAYGQVWHPPTDPEALTGREISARFGYGATPCAQGIRLTAEAA